MSDPPASGRPAPCLGNLRRVLWEAACVLVGGCMVGMLANAVSPRGLTLSRDYFPSGLSTRATAGATNRTATVRPPVSHSSTTLPFSPPSAIPALPPAPAPSVNVTTSTVPTATAVQAVVERLRQKGLQPAVHADVVRLFQDPRYAAGAVVFIDAREDRHFLEGHIPAARQFDHYRPERYLEEVLAVCPTAEAIVVYCNGGDCEDSEFAAITLVQAGVPAERLFVYAGGLEEWSKHGLTLEIGARLSGVYKEGTDPVPPPTPGVSGGQGSDKGP